MNISIWDTDADEELLDGWDSGRYAGDREVFSVLCDVGYVSKTLGDPRDCRSVERPNSVSEFRRALHARLHLNAERWDTMCDLLEANQARGLYFSW